jgi:hypothetical protein
MLRTAMFIGCSYSPLILSFDFDPASLNSSIVVYKEKVPISVKWYNYFIPEFHKSLGIIDSKFRILLLKPCYLSIYFLMYRCRHHILGGSR